MDENQRLEFLGDAVLDFLITSYLYSVYPNLKPGQLTDLRSYSVNNNSFAGISVNRSFYKFILCDSTSLTQSMNKYAEFLKTPSSKNGLVVDTVPCPKVTCYFNHQLYYFFLVFLTVKPLDYQLFGRLTLELFSHCLVP